MVDDGALAIDHAAIDLGDLLNTSRDPELVVDMYLVDRMFDCHLGRQDLLIKATDFEIGVPSIVFEDCLAARVHQAVDRQLPSPREVELQAIRNFVWKYRASGRLEAKPTR
jgi:hypothetical protein